MVYLQCALQTYFPPNIVPAGKCVITNKGQECLTHCEYATFSILDNTFWFKDEEQIQT